MKQKLLYAFIIILLVINSVLLFMLIKKPHENRKAPNRFFLISSLNFNKNQQEKFNILDENHHFNMKNIDDKVRSKKDRLFNSFGIENFNSTKLSKEIGELEAKKDQELFMFFNQVRNLCDASQKVKFDKIINEALKGGKPDRRRGDSNRRNGPSPRDGDRPPPRDGNRPPPRN